MVSIETAQGDPVEESVKRLLEEVLARHDTSRWNFTDRVIVERSAISHSHPVLTIGTVPNVRAPLGLLTTYLHEQIHWYLDALPDATVAAMLECKRLYPVVPDKAHGGARDDESTYLHLLVNWLELESLRLVVGQEDADATLRQAVGGPVYGWIYRRVFDDHSLISKVIAHHNLDSLVLK